MASPFTGINHLALITPDMDQTVRFYRDILGMDLVATIGHYRGDKWMRHYFFSLGPGNTLAFFEWDDVKDIGEYKPAGIPASGRQFDHVSFNVKDQESLLAMQQRLRERGVDVTEVIDHKVVHSIYFDDPHGISLEISYWLVDVEQTPVLMDERPVAAVTEKEQPAPVVTRP